MVCHGVSWCVMVCHCVPWCAWYSGDAWNVMGQTKTGVHGRDVYACAWVSAWAWCAWMRAYIRMYSVHECLHGCSAHDVVRTILECMGVVWKSVDVICMAMECTSVVEWMWC